MNSICDEKRLNELFNKSENPEEARKAITELHKIVKKPLEDIFTIMNEFNKMINYFSEVEITENPKMKKIVELTNKNIKESFIISVFGNTINTFNIPKSEFDKIMDSFWKQNENIEKQMEINKK